mgnify:CR=1 FL=1
MKSKDADDWYERGYEEGAADADSNIRELLIRIFLLESALKPFAEELPKYHVDERLIEEWCNTAKKVLGVKK